MAPPRVEHHNVEIKKGARLSLAAKAVIEQLSTGLQQAKLLGQAVQIQPESFVAVLEMIRQLAERVEKLEGVEVEPPPEGDDGKADDEAVTVEHSRILTA